jgi:hypothetical protein
MSNKSSGELSSGALAELADAAARARQGERVTIESLGIAVVPLADLSAIGVTDEEAEDGMIELDR